MTLLHGDYKLECEGCGGQFYSRDPQERFCSRACEEDGEEERRE